MSKSKQAAPKTWNYAGYTITINDAGLFTAEGVGDDKTISAATLEDVKKKIVAATREARTKRAVSLPVVGYVKSRRYSSRDWTDCAIASGTLVGINRTDRSLQIKGLPKGVELYDVCADTTANRELLTRRIAAYATAKELDRSFSAVEIDSSGYGRLSDDAEYERLLKSIESKHAKSTRVAKPSKRSA